MWAAVGSGPQQFARLQRVRPCTAARQENGTVVQHSVSLTAALGIAAPEFLAAFQRQANQFAARQAADAAAADN